jgi:NADH-quinone oxidoreductase subunit J
VEVAAFWVLAALLVGSALMVVLSRNLFHSVLWLALALTGTAGIFLALDAEFLAAVQILLYAGGIVTVVVFAIVVTERLVGERISQTNRRIAAAVVICGALCAAILHTILKAPLVEVAPPMTGDTTAAIGEAVLTRFALPFEMLAVLLLTALLAATYFARPED